MGAPAAAADAPTGPPPAPMVTVEPLAKGIWWLAGGSHHSVLVEFADHLTLIEAPLNEARALAVIAKAREVVPGKPLTQLVNSHHHFDHSGGVRAAISEGLTVITHQGNVAFFQEMAKRAHTIQPDALSKSGKTATVQGVSDQLTLTDPTMTMNLIAVSGPHSETMLVAHFPKEKLLVEVDVYTPGGAVQMFAGQFLEQLKTKTLAVDRVVPLHGAIAPYAQFVKEASAPVPTSEWRRSKSHRAGCRSIPIRPVPRSRCPRAPWTRTATSSAQARCFPTRRSASTRRATPARSCCSHSVTGWGSTRTSSSRPPATAPTTARSWMRFRPPTAAPAASPPSIAR
jgi:glyoxylase-like metal-dependent hydrolase (beta-lactamase superfamily II)